MLSPPVEDQLAPVNLFILLYIPAEIFEFSVNPQCKIAWPPGHLDRVFLFWTTSFMGLYFNSRVLWNDSLFDSCLNVLRHFMIKFYCQTLNILNKSFYPAFALLKWKTIQDKQEMLHILTVTVRKIIHACICNLK